MIIKKIFHIILLQLLLLTSSLVFASTNGTCQKAIRSFFSDATHRLIPQEGSVFAKFPDLVDKFELLYHKDINFLMFNKEFRKLHKRSPTIRETLHFVFQHKRQFLKNYVVVYKDLEKIGDSIADDLKIEILASMRKLDYHKSFRELEIDAERLANNLNINLDESLNIEKQTHVFPAHHRVIMESTRINYINAEFGELYALATTGNRIVSRDMHFFASLDKKPNRYEEMILEAVNNLEAKLNQMSVDQLISLVKFHHDGFFRKAYGYVRKTPTHQINKTYLIEIMITMVKSKEIDLVTTKNGKTYYWVEVKALSKQITRESLMKHPISKPMYNQLMEHKILRDLLGLEDKVNLIFTSTTSRIAPDAVKALKELGYIAVGARVDYKK